MSNKSCRRVVCALIIASASIARGQTILRHFNQAPAYPRGGVVAYNGVLYGATSNGGYYGLGAVYSVDPATSTPAILASFTGAWNPNDLIVVGSYLYGTTYDNGAGGGRIFRFDPATNALTVLASFNNSSGTAPVGRLAASGSVLFGVARSGGTYGSGTVFKFDTTTNVLSRVASFGGSDTFTGPNGGMALSGSLLYGTAQYGGDSGAGGIFTVDVNGTSVTKLASFNGTTEGGYPTDGPVIIGSFLYGTTDGSSNGTPRIYKHPISGSGLTVLASLAGGTRPFAGLTAVGNTLYGVTQFGGSSLTGQGSIFQVDSVTGSLTTLGSFFDSTGTHPSARLTAVGPLLYGTTASGGSLSGQGVVFRFDPATAMYTKLFELNPAASGSFAWSGMTALGSYLYGVTLVGGNNGGAGSIYRLDPATGTVDDPWRSFAGSGNGYVPSFGAVGSYPYSRLVTDGTYLYGTTSEGGANNYGAIYKLDPAAQTITNLVSFDSSNYSRPWRAGLLYDNGLLYGTTAYGGANGNGTVFKVSTMGGAPTVLASFPAGSRWNPESELLMVNGFLYGTTLNGGAYGQGSVYKVDAVTGAMSTVVNFGADIGRAPFGGLILHGGFLWGLTAGGGTSDAGTIYKVEVATGGITTVLSLSSDFYSPQGSFFSDGTYFYATSYYGGGNLKGSVFKFNPATSALTNLGTFTGTNGSLPACTLAQSGSLLYGTTPREGAYGGGVLFSIAKNAPPTITAAAAAARTAGAGASVSTVATVTDFEDLVGSLTVTATSVPANIIVSNISNSSGTISASIEAQCSAAGGANTITFRVADSNGATASANFTVNVTSASCSLVPSPQGVTATALSSAIIRIQWQAVGGATGYRVYRSTGNTAFTCISCGPNAYTQTTIDDGNVFANTTYVYRVLAAQGAFLSDPSAPDAATTLMFAHDPLVTGAAGPFVGATHLTELRTAVNAMRAAAGLGPATFTDPSPAGVRIKAVHVTELRTALNAARAAIGCAVLGAQSWPCGLPALSYTDPSLAAGAQIKAAHFQELRNGIK